MWVTERDEAMIEWLSLVKITSMEGVRWMLGALNGTDGPVSLRKAQSWCARMETVQLVERGRVSSVGGALVWPTHAASGRTPPSLLRQTTRHEVAVSIASARYVAAGWSWDKDRAPAEVGTVHSADGIAFRDDAVELVEVELTGKRPQRYRQIFSAFSWRIAREGVTAIRYFCTDSAARAVRAALQDPHAGGRALAERVHVHAVFDGRGVWESAVQPKGVAAGTSTTPAGPVQGMFDEQGE
ncbi:hypothetical protein [Cellulosimicrobium sp. NPDC057862]|uniref:hypothetical protein n=1 Tax=Cellulosimicrobium sp. NPDC057862 TaxID=3346266 RepID=UPI00366D92E2